MALCPLFIASCSSYPHGSVLEDVPPKQKGKFTDWDQVDWKFNRHILASAYMMNSLRPDDAGQKYDNQIAYDAILPAVSLAEFLALSPRKKEARRAEAESHHYQGLALQRTVNRGWEIWTDSRIKAVPDAAMSDEMGIVTPAIKHLRTAQGLDPSNPVRGYDLGYFAGIVGDRKLQREALAQALAAVEVRRTEDSSPLWLAGDDLARLRVRILLDQAWLERDEGFFAAGLMAVNQAIDQMANDTLRTLDEAREAVLLQALLTADSGEIYEARQRARNLPEWRLAVGKAPAAQSAGSSAPPLRKENQEHIDSSFAHDWVWIMTFMQQGAKEQALKRMREKNYVTEYPAHINYRFWRDMGRVLEHFGERRESRLRYGFSIIYHPYFPYFPLSGARGISRVLDQTGAGQTYYLGYDKFYISGSRFSYAANRVVSMEMAADSTATRDRARLALDALSICIRHNTKPASARALRGWVHYRLGNQVAAMKDLVRAEEQLREAGRESAEALKLLAIIHHDREEYAQSLTRLDRYRALKSTDGFGWRLTGLCQAHLGNLDAANDQFIYSLQLDPHSYNAWFNLALVHLQKGETDRARELLAEAQTRFPNNGDIAHLQQLIRQDPVPSIRMTSGEIELRATLADSLWYARATTNSRIDVAAGLTKEEASKLLPEYRRQYHLKADADSRLALARLLVKLNFSGEVQELLKPFWPDRLTHAEVMILLIADRDNHDRQRALELATRLRYDTNPYPDSEFWALVGIICLENGARSQGLAALELARQLDPDNAALQSASAFGF